MNPVSSPNTYCHAIQWKMPMDFKLIGCCQASTCVQQDIIKLKSKDKHH